MYVRLSLSSAIAALILVILVFIAMISIHFFVTSFTGNREVRVKLEMLRIEGIRAYDVGFGSAITIYAKNIGSIPTTVDMVYFLDSYGNTLLAKHIDPVKIPPRSTIPIYFLLTKEEVEKLRESSVLYLELGTEGGATSSLSIESSAIVNAPRLTVYLVNVSGVSGNWGSPKEIVGYLESLGARVVLVDSFDKLYELVRNPPDNAIVMNAHDEVVPMPRSWDDPNRDDYDDCSEFFKAIARNIRDHGWIWVSIRGYPFFYCYIEGKGRIKIDSPGISEVLSVVGGGGIFWSDAVGVEKAYLTDTARLASRALGLELPESVCAIRQAIELAGVYPALVFYDYRDERQRFLASAAYAMGRGYLVINGICGSDRVPDDVAAKIAVVTALYTAMTRPPTPSPRGPRSISDVYLLAIPEARCSWSCDGDLNSYPGFVRDYVEGLEFLGSRLGFKLHHISTFEDFENLLLSAPRGIAVVNVHGEAVPIPPMWISTTTTTSPRIEDVSISYTLGEDRVVELYTAGANDYFTIYKDISSYVNEFSGLKIVLEIAPLAPCHSFAIGFCLGTDISDTSQRVYEIEVRLRNNDPSNHIDLVTWLNNRVEADNLGIPNIVSTKWYRLEIEFFRNGTARMRAYDESDNLIASYSGIATDPSYNDVRYLCLGIFGTPSGGASYLVKHLELYGYRGTQWSEILAVDPSTWASSWDGVVGSLSSGYRWRALYGVIAWNIARYGWRWLSIKGYPFFYVADSSTLYTVGTDGWKHVKFFLGIDIDRYQVQFYDAGEGDEVTTDLGDSMRRAFNGFYIPRWIYGSYIPRPAKSLDISEAVYFNETTATSVVYIARAGSGYVVLSGLGGSYTLDMIAIDTLLATALYLGS